MTNENQRANLTAATLALMLAVGIVGANGFTLSPVAADVASALGASVSGVGLAMASYSATVALAALLLAPQLDRIGPSRGLALALAGLAAGIAVTAAAPNLTILILGQATSGLCAGVVLPACYGLATRIAPAGREATVLGRVITGWSVALVAGVPLSALAADAFGWRAAFAILALVALTVLALVAFLPRVGAAAPGSRHGLLQTLRLMGAMGVRRLLTITTAFMAAFYAAYSFMGAHLAAEGGLSASQIGLVVLAYGLGFGLGTAVDPYLDRLGPRRVFPVTLTVQACVLLGFALAPATLPAFAALMLVWGIANHANLNILVLLLSQERPQSKSALLGLNSAITYLSASLGVAVAGALFELFGYGGVMMMAVGLMLGGIIIADTIRRDHGRQSGCVGTDGASAAGN